MIGASYTSVSFLAGFSRRLEERRNLVTVGFIIVSAAIYLALGKAPVTLLVLAGALNGLILPVGFADHPVGGRPPDRPAPRLPLPEVAARRRSAGVGAHRLPRVELPRRHRGPAVTGPRIDLNADLGESFGSWTLGDDDALLEVITSANVACGFHAGDPTVLRRTCARGRRARRRDRRAGGLPRPRGLRPPVHRRRAPRPDQRRALPARRAGGLRPRRRARRSATSSRTARSTTRSSTTRPRPRRSPRPYAATTRRCRSWACPAPCGSRWPRGPG